jgi:hypothetical protein
MFLTHAPRPQGFFCQMLAGGLPASISLPIDQCVVPSGINGVVAIWITSDDQPLNGNAVQRQSNAIVAGPLLAFLDVVPSSLGELVRNNGNSLPPPPTTTTVSLSQASSILSSADASTSTPPPSASGSAATANGISMIPVSLISSIASASTSSAPAPNGISMVPVPTSSSS